jgi:DNA mismatch repair protein MutS
LDEGYQTLCQHFKVSNLNGFGVRASDGIVGAASALLTYVRDVTFTDLSHVRSIQRYTVAAQMMIDEATKMNLEILEPQKGTNKQHTLIHLLDKTRTAMGGRLLRKWVSAPLVDLARIQRRQDAVEAMLNDELRLDVQGLLQSVYDLERLSGKLAQMSIHPKALRSLAQSILLLPKIFTLLKDIDAFKGFIPDAVPTDMAEGLLVAIDEDAPITINEGGIFASEYNAELDELRKLTNEVKMAIAEMEDAQREATGIASLKIKHNRVFGYFLEVTTANKDKVPEDWIRKQTLSNAERYVTPSLKEFEEKILTSGERAKALEQQLFCALREEASQYVGQLQKLAQRISYIDVFCSLADVAIQNRYCRPTVDLSLNISLRQSRHPIIEQLSMLETFIPNDVQIDSNKRQILLTGPNMSGKSTIMRQVALTVLMAQMGSFVPADSAHIGLCDTIFVRVGASDDLAEGRSTFMVEMSETAYILNQATEQSLLLLDEIGRGTSTYDGMSIAWAVAEAIHNKIKARCIFATHYHELTRLNDTCEHIHNMHVAIQEDRGEIRFLRVLQDGAIGKSYGIQCARLAGLPRTVIRRATQILKDLEVQAAHEKEVQLSLFGEEESSEDSSEEVMSIPDYMVALVERLHDLPLDDHSPFEALKELYELQKIIRNERAKG